MGSSGGNAAPDRRPALVFTFGLFTLDAARLELQRSGEAVKIQDKPLRLLIRLVASAGEVVSRDQLVQELWPADTFVEFDVGLATAVKKVRQILGDSAANPRFIETIPKQGYRFIAPVQIIFPAGKPEAALAVAAVAPVPASMSRRLWLVGGAAGLGLGAALLVWRGSAGEPRPGPIRITPLTSHPGTEAHPCFSPDGSQVVFAWNGERQDNTDLYVATNGGGGIQRLTSDVEADDYPTWSPDGLYIAYTQAASRLMLVSARGGTPRKLADASGYHTAWSPDSSSILFGLRPPDNEMSDLFAISVQGEIRRLTAPVSQVFSYFPFGYSPNGRWFLFSKRDDGRSPFQLYLVPAEGGEPQRVSSFDYPIRGWSWISDREILVSMAPGGRFELWRMALDRGTNPPLVPAEIGEGEFPAITRRPASAGGPQTAMLAYQRRQLIRNLYGVTLPRGVPVRLAPSTRVDSSPRISPDGSKMVFISDRSGFIEVWLSTADGANTVALTSFAAPNKTPGSPKWAPDGRSIAFDLGGPGPHRIYTLRVDGGTPRRLVDWDCETIRPSWSRDGKWIYFGANPAERYEIWKVPADGVDVPRDQARQVTENGGWEAEESLDGRRLFYVRSRRATDLWEVTPGGGQGAPLIPSGISHGWWSVAEAGIFYADVHIDQSLAQHFETDRPILFYRFANKRSEKVGAIRSRVNVTTPDFCASSDGKRIVYVQIDLDNTNIMVGSGFR